MHYYKTCNVTPMEEADFVSLLGTMHYYKTCNVTPVEEADFVSLLGHDALLFNL